MSYSLATKLSVLQQISQGMSVCDASELYSIPHQTIRLWIKSPDNCFDITTAPHTIYSIEKKVQILELFENSHLSISKFASLNNLKSSTVRDWVRNKKRILAIYSSQGKSPVKTKMIKSPGKEVEAVSTAGDEDTKKHFRDLKNENEYLKAKVAFLEALMEINGTPVPAFKKNFCIKPSTESSEKGSET